MKTILLAALIIAGLSHIAAAEDAATPKAIVEKALATARTIENVDERIYALEYIAKHQGKIGDRLGAATTWREVVKTAGVIKSSEKRIRMMQDALQLERSADDSLAQETLRLAVELEIANHDPSLRSIDREWIAIGQARIGDVAGALATAKVIQEPERRADTLTEIAIVEAEAGNRLEAKAILLKALSDANRIARGFERDLFLSSIAVAQAENFGDFDGAFATVRTMGDVRLTLESLAGIAVAQSKAGKTSDAQATLGMILHAARDISSTDDRAAELELVVDIVCFAKMADAAITVSNAIINSGYRGGVLELVVQNLIGVGAINAALAASKAIDDVDVRSSELVSVAAALAERHRFDEAAALIKEIEGESGPEALASIAAVQFGIGDVAGARANLQKARSLALRFKDTSERDRTLIEVCAAQAGKDQNLLNFLGTLMATLEYANEDFQAKARNLVHGTPPDVTYVEVAIGIAHAISDPYARLECLAEVATPLLRVGDHEKLGSVVREALATSEASPSDKDANLNSVGFFIASVQVAAQDIAGALATARRIEEQEARSATLAMIAWAQESLGDSGAKTTLREALSHLQELNARDRDRLLRVAAIVQSRIPDIKLALETADRIADLGERVETLVDLATQQPPFRFGLFGDVGG
jgi:tetratricopeptide (TPR) repeat protein